MCFVEFREAALDNELLTLVLHTNAHSELIAELFYLQHLGLDVERFSSHVVIRHLIYHEVLVVLVAQRHLVITLREFREVTLDHELLALALHTNTHCLLALPRFMRESRSKDGGRKRANFVQNVAKQFLSCQTFAKADNV
jgi:hypothetical protein